MRRRKTRYHWLLNTGTTGPAANVEDDFNGRDLAITVNANGTTSAQIVDLLEDRSSDDAQQGTPIAVTSQNDYFIKRIVGKVHLACRQAATESPHNVMVAFGIFVARASDADDFAGAEDFPIGDPADQVNNYSPLRNENIREPWIWRRTWVLGNALSLSPLGADQAVFPTTNVGYGSVMDGPHIDAKTARRVRDGERLFAILAARTWRPNFSFTEAIAVEGTVDYRVLGQLRKARNRSVF